MKMIYVDMRVGYEEAITESIAVLERGGVVLFPTDTVYCLVANAMDRRAVERVYKIKQRPLNKPLPIAVRNLKWVREVAHVPPRLEPVLEKLWPGSVTAMLEKKSVIPDIVTAGTKSITLRIPDYPMLEALMARYGYPLTLASANISGEEAIPRIDDIVSSLARSPVRPDLVIDVGTLPPAEPSTIIDLRSDRPKIIRIGASKPQKLLELLSLEKRI